MTIRRVAPWCLAAAALALPSRADAHRLDEYLQAARITVSIDRVSVEIDLSPGVAIADGVIRSIDANADGRISDTEADTYAAGVLRATTLSVDGRPVPLRLEQRAFPDIGAIRDGVGAIRLRATAPLPSATGRRHLAFSNAYEPRISAYLVNAMEPSDRRVTIAGQQRDPLQRTYVLDYDVAGSRTWVGWSGAALAMLGVLLIGRRKTTRS